MNKLINFTETYKTVFFIQNMLRDILEFRSESRISQNYNLNKLDKNGFIIVSI